MLYEVITVVFNAERNAAVHQSAHVLRSECVVAVTGQVMARPEESRNPNLPTGDIEIFVDAVEILNEAKTPPFVIEDDAEVTEAIRLKYRYLDLRRPRMQKLLSLRHGIAQAARGFLNAEQFRITSYNVCYTKLLRRPAPRRYTQVARRVYQDGGRGRRRHVTADILEPDINRFLPVAGRENELNRGSELQRGRHIDPSGRAGRRRHRCFRNEIA